MIRRPLNVTGVLTMLALCTIWGFQQVAMKAMAVSADPLLQVAIRSSGAAILVWTYSRLWRRDQWVNGLAWREGLVVGALFGIEYLFVGIGLRHTGSGLMSVLLYTAPVFAAIGLHLALREERLAWSQWVGCIASFVGVSIIFLFPSDAGHEPVFSRDLALLGALCGLLAGLCWGLTTVAVRVSRLSEAPFSQTPFYQLLGGGIFAWPVVIFFDYGSWQPSVTLVALTFYQTAIVCFASYLVWFWLLQRYLASRLGVISLLTPVIAVLLGALLLGEEITIQFMASTVLIVAGIATMMLSDVRSRRTKIASPN